MQKTKFILVVGDCNTNVQLWLNKLVQTHQSDQVMIKDGFKLSEPIEYTLPEKGDRVAYLLYNLVRHQIEEKAVTRFLSALKLPDAPQVLLLMHVAKLEEFPSRLIPLLNSVHIFPSQSSFETSNLQHLEEFDNVMMPNNELDICDVLTFCYVDRRVLTIPFDSAHNLVKL